MSVMTSVIVLFAAIILFIGGGVQVGDGPV